jgi:hypothetical protein
MSLLFLPVVLVALGAGAASSADHTLGTWKRNIEQSKSNRPSSNPYTSLISVREAIPNGVRVRVTSVRQDGTRSEFGYTAPYDGTPVKLTGSEGPFDMLSVKQVDANTLLIENWKAGGTYRTKSKSVVSPDGKRMVNTVTGVDGQGNELRFTIVYDKQIK